MPIFWKSWLVGSSALAVTLFMIALTLRPTGEPLQSTMIINSVLGCYLIGSTVSYYLMKQSEKLRASLAQTNVLHEQLAVAHEKLRRHAKLDIMTGMLNREAFFNSVEAAKASRLEGNAVILIADIDNFKNINDTWGHMESDNATLLVAQTIIGASGSDALVGRIGGEEFAIYLDGGNDGEAADLAEFIRTQVAAIEFYPVANMRHPLAVSIGVAAAKNDGVTTDLVRRADRTLYKAKDAGRNCVRFESAA